MGQEKELTILIVCLFFGLLVVGAVLNNINTPLNTEGLLFSMGIETAGSSIYHSFVFLVLLWYYVALYFSFVIFI
ncbi:MAG: hypothetical protein IAX21_10245 [Candidatus Bathyarchaeota archaeon]|nr:hypothetical protein [Candidatus Bathyarchaeum tardum]WGM88744.1 MAG: hypothetical protein NUK63_07430 [Candidatus Bathyarchaeum tardum]WNZ29002.1 MAG: hypothetical protein IAX21_10245 [Candidatus Bathyarchaeota archaeon]